MDKMSYCVIEPEEQSICPWVKRDNRLYFLYHQYEWGRPIVDECKLFEQLCLEGQQAGLSWLTVLTKREAYRQAFCQFDPYQIATLTPQYLTDCLTNSQLIRHRLKLQSIYTNAVAFINMAGQGIAFNDFLWGFIGGVPHVNHFNCIDEVPTQNSTSLAMSQALKKHGFKFVGPTVCYAFMEAVGMYNNHLTSCQYRFSGEDS